MIYLRPATMEDADLLLSWRNETAARENSRNCDLISRDAHMGWLKVRIDNPEHEVWIAEQNECPVGTIRFDARNEGAFEIGIIIDPNERGRGLGFSILDLICNSSAKADKTLIADIKADNLASRRIFEKCGFVRIDQGVRPVWLYRRRPLSDR